MKKSILLLLIPFIFMPRLFAQSVAINTDGSAATASSILDIKSTTKGLLIPRMTTVQRTAIAVPAKGLIVFDITTNGLWFHNGTAWNALSSGSSTNYWSVNGSDIYNNTSGNVGIGTTTPLGKLHIAGDVKIDGNNSIEFGANLVGKEFNAGKIGYQTFTAGALDITGAGTDGTNRKIKFWNEGGASFTGNVGIGTASPVNKLQIGTFSGNVTGNDIAIGNGTQAMSFYQSATTSGWYTTTNFILMPGNGGTGNVGVGVSNPIYKMDIADRIRIRNSSATNTTGIALNNSNNSAEIAFIGTVGMDLVGVWGNVAGWGLLMNTNTGTVGIGYQNPVAGYRLSVLGNQYIDGLIKTSGDAEIGGRADVTGNLYVGGKIGVGGTAVVPIEVFSDVDFTSSDQWTEYDNCTGACFSSELLCIRAHGRILAERFIAYSDARMKNIKAFSNSAKDLEIIKALQITDYTMKDKINYGSIAFKKVIAQEVEKIYPQVVAKTVGCIPNVYAVPAKIEKTVNGYLLSFSDKHNLSKAAKKIQLIVDRETKQFDIFSIPSENQVEIKTADLKTDKVFVYGEEVDDLRTVDYEGLTTLNISATQELSKLIKKQQAIIETQQQQIDLLLKRMDAVEKK